MTMAMVVENLKAVEQAGLGAAGVEDLRWIKPVYPGDTLRCETEILETRASRSRPDMGSFRSRLIVFNQHDEPVMRFVSSGLIRRRPEA